ncbi:hypothetical protein L1887_18252 [Cichorium endivia]|nr:hypothetical protein L1887_18252 [Cichorium endivia]
MLKGRGGCYQGMLLYEQFAATSEVQRNSDAQEMQAFYQHYYGNYIQGLKSVDEVDRNRLTKAYQTAAVLFEVLMAVSSAESVPVADEIFEAHAEISNRNTFPLRNISSNQVLPRHHKVFNANTRVYENAEMDTQNIFPTDPESSDQVIVRHPEMKHQKHLKIPLHVIKRCTQSFNEKNSIGRGGYGRVYIGILSWGYHENKLVAVKRLDVTGHQGNKEFYTEVMMLAQYQHQNIITLIGFCDDDNEMIIVYEYASRGSLDTYLRHNAMSDRPSWPQLFKICIGVTSALDYLHNNVAEKHRIIHRDIKSANILLDENWNPKLSDFGLSRIGLANQENTFVITNIAGTHGYCDPQYERTGFLTKESDIYSLGVVFFEVLSGRLACVLSYNDERRFLHHLARTCYGNGDLHKIIDPRIRNDIKPGTLSKLSAIAYQCLKESREERPTIAKVASQLIEIQLEDDTLQDETRNMKKAPLEVVDLFKPPPVVFRILGFQSKS